MHLPFVELEKNLPPWAQCLIRLASACCVGILLGWSLVMAFAAVEPCQVSREWDILRDVSIAQAIHDGRYPEDPILLGEISWYNPLTGALLLLMNWLSGISLMRLAVISGPFINMLAPIGFYLLVSRLFGRLAGLAGLCLMLFGKEGNLPFWTCTYAPWLLAPMYSKGLLFITLVSFMKAMKSEKTGYYYLTGLMLGITFMSHTAPAVIAGAVMLLLTGMEMFSRWRADHSGRQLWRPLLLFVLLLAIAFICSLPYSGPILWQYQFRVHNPWPSLYASQNVELQNLPTQIRNAISARNVIAAFGAAMLLKYRNRIEARLMMCWVFVVIGLMVQHYLWQYLRLNNIVMTSIVPGHHAAIHLACVRTVLFGVGVVFVPHALLKIKGMAFCSSERVSPVFYLMNCMIVGLAGVVLYLGNPYSQRTDFKPPGEKAYYDLFERYLPMYNFIRTKIPPESVFITPNESLGIQIVMPAARKLVHPMLLYCNPYVERGILTMRHEAILSAIEAGDADMLCETAGIYPYLFMLLEEPVNNVPALSKEIYRAGGVVLYKLQVCSPLPSI